MKIFITLTILVTFLMNSHLKLWAGEFSQKQNAEVLKLSLEPGLPPARWDTGSDIDAENAWFGLRVTNDGGLSWNEVALTENALSRFGLPGAKPHTSFYEDTFHKSFFITVKHGWLNPVISGPKPNALWETNDGGTTWKKISEWGYSSISFYDALHGWILMPQLKGNSLIYITNDEARTWKECGGIPTSDHISGVYFTNPESGWAFKSYLKDKDVQYGVVRTHDAGCTWNLIWKSSGEFQFQGEIYFLNDRNGWIAPGRKPYSILYTEDGGISWRPIGKLISSREILSIFFWGPKEGWIIDSGDIVYETNDLGMTWRRIETDEFLSWDPRKIKDWKKGNLLRIVLRAQRKY